MAQQSKTREGCYVSSPSPTQGKVQCKGDATWHLLSPHTASELSRVVQGGSGAVAGSGLCQAHLPLRRQKGSSGAGTRMVLKMGW